MQIPLYFVTTRKESLNEANARRIGFGYGFTPDGAARMGVEEIADAPILLDDAVLPEILSERAVAELALCGTNGIILDFERPHCAAHDKLIDALQSALPARTPLWAPERYLRGTKDVGALRSCPTLCNSYRQFCAAGAAFTNWMLELTPRLQTKPSTGENFPARFLENALCFVARENGRLRYFDTRETLRRKLALAQRYGCVAAVGLYSEYPDK